MMTYALTQKRNMSAANNKLKVTNQMEYIYSFFEVAFAYLFLVFFADLNSQYSIRIND